jgi:hypothetical protein
MSWVFSHFLQFIFQCTNQAHTCVTVDLHGLVFDDFSLIKLVVADVSMYHFLLLPLRVSKKVAST